MVILDINNNNNNNNNNQCMDKLPCSQSSDSSSISHVLVAPASPKPIKRKYRQWLYKLRHNSSGFRQMQLVVVMAFHNDNKLQLLTRSLLRCATASPTKYFPT